MKQHIPLEKTVVANIMKYLSSLPNCRAKKFHGTQFGQKELDIYGSLDGRAFFIEVKRPGGKLSVIQEVEIDTWRSVGAIAGVAYGVDDVRKLLGVQ